SRASRRPRRTASARAKSPGRAGSSALGSATRGGRGDDVSEERQIAAVPRSAPWSDTGYWGPTNPDEHPAVRAVREQFPDAYISAYAFRDEMTIRVERSRFRDVIQFLRDHPDLQYTMLSDETAVDMLRLRPRSEEHT